MAEQNPKQDAPNVEGAPVNPEADKPKKFDGIDEASLNYREPFTLKPTQDLSVHRFVQYEKDKKGIFMLHGVGSGKTITSMTIAINFMLMKRNAGLDNLDKVDGNAFKDQNVERQIVVIVPTGLRTNFHKDIVVSIPRVKYESSFESNKTAKVIYSYNLGNIDVEKNTTSGPKLYFLVHYLEYRDLKNIWAETDATKIIQSIHDIVKGRIVIFDEVHRLLRPTQPGSTTLIADKIIKNRTNKQEIVDQRYPEVVTTHTTIFKSARKLILMTGTPFVKGVQDFAKLLTITNLSSKIVEDFNANLYDGQEDSVAYNFDFTNTKVKDFFTTPRNIPFDDTVSSNFFIAVSRIVYGVKAYTKIDGIKFATSTEHPQFPEYTGKKIKQYTKRQINKDYKLAYDLFSMRSLPKFLTGILGISEKTIAQLLKEKIQFKLSAGTRSVSQKTRKQRGGDIKTVDEAKTMFGYTTEAITEEDVRKRFKQLSLQLHPDRSSGDTKKFQDLQAARDILLSDLPSGEADVLTDTIKDAAMFGLTQMNIIQRDAFVEKILAISRSPQFQNLVKSVNREYLEVELLAMLPNQYFRLMDESMRFIETIDTNKILDTLSRPIPPEVEKLYHNNLEIVNHRTDPAIQDQLKTLRLTGGDPPEEINITKDEEDYLSSARLLAEHIKIYLLAAAGISLKKRGDDSDLQPIEEVLSKVEDVIECVNGLDVKATGEALVALDAVLPSPEMTGGDKDAWSGPLSLLLKKIGAKEDEDTLLGFDLKFIKKCLKSLALFGIGGYGAILASIVQLIQAQPLRVLKEHIDTFQQLYVSLDASTGGAISYYATAPIVFIQSLPVWGQIATAVILVTLLVCYGYRTSTGRRVRRFLSDAGNYVSMKYNGLLISISGNEVKADIKSLYDNATANGDTYYASILRAELEKNNMLDGDFNVTLFAEKTKPFLSLIDSVMPNVTGFAPATLKQLEDANNVTVDNKRAPTFISRQTKFNYPKRVVECIYVPYTAEQLCLYNHFKYKFEKHIEKISLLTLNSLPWYLYTLSSDTNPNLIGNVSRSVMEIQNQQIVSGSGDPISIYKKDPPVAKETGDLKKFEREQGRQEEDKIVKFVKTVQINVNRYIPNVSIDDVKYECPKFKKIVDYLLFMKLGYLLSVDNAEIVEQPHFTKEDTDNDFGYLENIALKNADRHFLPFVYSTSDVFGLNLFGSYLNKLGFRYITLHDEDNAAANAENLKAATEFSWKLLKRGVHLKGEIKDENIKDFVMLNLIGMEEDPKYRIKFEDFLTEDGKKLLKEEPLCILLHPFKTEGVNGKHNPAIIMMDPPLNYGDYEQLCGRVLRTYSSTYDSAPVKRVYQVVGYTYPGIDAALLEPYDGVEANVNATTKVERAEVGMFFDVNKITLEGVETPVDPYDMYNTEGNEEVTVTSLVRKETLNYAGYQSLTDIIKNAKENLKNNVNPTQFLNTILSDTTKAGPSFRSLWENYLDTIINNFRSSVNNRETLLTELEEFISGMDPIQNETFIKNAKTHLRNYNKTVIGCMLAQIVENVTNEIGASLDKKTDPNFRTTIDTVFGVKDADYINEAAVVDEITQIKSIQKNAYLFGKYMGVIKGPPEENRIPDLEQLIVSVKDDVKGNPWCKMFPKQPSEICGGQKGGKRNRTQRNKNKSRRRR